MKLDFMIQFRLRGPMHRAPTRGYAPGEECLMRIMTIACLFPAHQQVRTVDGLTLDVYAEDWNKVEKAFRNAFLGNEIKAV